MATNEPTPPFGQQFTIRFENQVAVINEVGATLHAYRVEDKPIVDGPTDPDGLADVYKGSRGHLLMPWPNRVADGKYEFEGKSFQLPINEVARGHASHGFCRVFAWDATQTENEIQLSAIFHAQVGYPFPFAATLNYHLDETGLTVTIAAVNLGSFAMPFGVGMHPYITSGALGIDDNTLTVDAGYTLAVNDKMIPVGEPEPVDGTKYDLRSGASLTGLVLDTPLTGLGRDEHGLANVTVTSADGGDSTTVWMDESFPYIMIFTGDTLSNPSDKRTAIAIEPMSCAPDAFNNGDGLRILQPGETFTGRWGVSHHGRTF